MSHRSQPNSYTTWERLEPVARDYELTEPLRAPIRDPAWLLARQRQLGEFRGNDGGSPVAVELDYVQEALSAVDLPGGDRSIPYEPGDSPPLEAIVERERVLTDPDEGPSHRVRVEAGMNFLSRLRTERRERFSTPSAELPDPKDFPAELRLSMDDEHLDAAARRFELIAGERRALDGYAVYDTLREHVPGIADGDPDWRAAPASELPRPASSDGPPDAAFEAAAGEFYAWYDDLYAEPAADTGDGWNEDRLAYEFEATTTADEASTTFEVPQYDGDRLDWDDFSVARTSDGTATSESLDPPPTPTRLTFRGMPAPRYWELEDADVDLSELSAAPEDVSWMLLAEIALVSGNKWFSLPLDAPYGSLTRITNFNVVDTFGETTPIEPAGPLPPTQRADGPDAKGWNAFLSPLPGRSDPGLLVPPVVGSSLRSDPIERVRFARDEAANLVFAIESLAEGPLGDPLDRREFDRPRLEVPTLHPASDPDDEYVELANEGDDELAIDGWRLEVRVDAADFQFEWTDDVDGEWKPCYEFADVTVEPRSSIRLYTGGAPAHDTADRLHVGASRSLWARGEQLRSYRVNRPPIDGEDERQTVLAAPVGATAESSLPRYRLATDVPDHWFPLAPTPTGADDYRLEVALLLDADTLDDTIYKAPKPMGRVLDPDASIDDEAVTRQGIEIDRRYYFALGADGRGHLWSGRIASVGSGQESSGLRFDLLDEPATTSD